MKIRICDVKPIEDVVCIMNKENCSTLCKTKGEIEVDREEFYQLFRKSHKEQVEFILNKIENDDRKN